MSTQEIKVHPLNVRPGDVVISVKSDVEITVRREVVEVPTALCSIGYATAHGVTDIFVVRTDDAAGLSWFLPAPARMEGHAVRWLRSDEISEFRPLIPIDPATVDVEAIGSALYQAMKGIESGVFSWDAVARTALAQIGIEVAP